MPEVLVLCEGKSEKEFCRSVVAPALEPRGIYLSATLAGQPHKKHGGGMSWQRYKKELLRLGSERAGRIVGLVVDYYALPTDWPGRADAPARTLRERSQCVEDAMKEDLRADLQDRLLPCVQLHEFESLLFVDPEITAMNIAFFAGLNDHSPIAREISSIKSSFRDDVEAINDSPHTAPSKRLVGVHKAYDKVATGVQAALDADLADLRASCPWLDRWMSALEALGE